jgi:hypothetical protein
MPSTFKVVALVWVVLSVRVAYAQSPGNGIRGTLRENGTPITEATVYLQSLDDEKCAKLFSGKKWTAQSVAKLGQCMHDVGTTSVDGAGTYRFLIPKSGWYVVHFLWNISKKPSQSGSLRKEGTWGVIYAGHKDETGKYDTMAQDSPCYFSGTEDVVRNFELKP